ncbi:MAG: nucleotidyl transferase AbiEii/AbiGii toxin family protein [Nannocystis sp.]|nr:nucleotidyl transferase AbiEii/AbiGii toxin family protein [Nannocystis sp.]MBA3546400.1 nucleotidyl transferase AbiEii/AbiGii toxin family protein [Nannocystis sp.]
MIARDYITEWRAQAPWIADAQVEQDMVISRALVEIFGASGLAQRLAFRGGTALFKLHLRPPARYSEDIDLVQITSEPIGETFGAVRAALDPWLGSPKFDHNKLCVKLTYRFDSEDQPPKPMKLKIEINSREHFTELGYVQAAFEVRSRWWSGSATITTFALDEMLGTKLRALYQRRKGRDVFDLWYALTQASASPERIVACFDRYMREGGHSVSRAMFEKGLQEKLSNSLFRADMTPLLRPGVNWDVDRAGALVMEQLIARLP